jgi:hypothetical protein
MIATMSDTSVIPASLTVRNLLEDLLGRDVTVNPGAPLDLKDLSTAVVAIFVDHGQQLVAVIGLDLTLAANAGAALGLLPAGAAEDAVEARQLPPSLAENVGELCNVLTSLLNREGAPHVKLHQVIYPGTTIPNDAQAHLLALGRRLDLSVEISRYGKGRFSLSMAP